MYKYRIDRCYQLGNKFYRIKHDGYTTEIIISADGNSRTCTVSYYTSVPKSVLAGATVVSAKVFEQVANDYLAVLIMF